MAEKAKVTHMVLDVDLQCNKCYKKVKNVLCKFPQIQDQRYDEKNNIVRITVICCGPEKIRDKLCSKGGGSIKSIEIGKRVTFNPELEIFNLPKEPEKPKEPKKKPAEKPKVPEKPKEKAADPPKTEKPKVVTFGLPPKAQPAAAAPGYPAACHVPVGFSCSDYYGGGGGCPCCGPPGRYYDGYYGRPVYDSWGGGGGGYRGYHGSGSNQYFCEENSQGCRIM